jgi:hypothetical protein
MIAYQVFTGDTDKHGRQTYELQATYLDNAKAMEHCHRIIKNDTLKNEHIEKHALLSKETETISWNAVGWDIVTVCQMNKITITE